MFHRGSIVVRILLALIVLGGFVMASALSYRVGLARGYAKGAATTDSEEITLPPIPAPPAFFAPRLHHVRFFPFPLLRPLFCGGILLLIVLAALVRPPFWHHPGPWAAHAHWPRPPHPWSECPEPPANEETKTEDKAR